MTQIVLSDAQYWQDFLPLTFTRPTAQLRCGILTFEERWRKLLGDLPVTYLTEDYLQSKYPLPEAELSLFLVSHFIPSPGLVEKIRNLETGHALVYKDELLAAKVHMADFSLRGIHTMEDVEDLYYFSKPTDLFSYNEVALEYDFNLITKGRDSAELSQTNGVVGDLKDVFIEEGAVIEYCTFNTRKGKIYIGNNAEIMEGSHIRGPFALCEGSVVNMGAKIYGATTIGPYSKVGGELNNVVLFGYSNKGHDGFLGNSVVGEWCNLGADTNSSNLKNNYASVKLWNYKKMKFVDTGLQFCGLIMGDHSKTAINTQLNTGTVVGLAANIFKSGFPPNLVENFSWGGAKGDEKFRLDRAYEVAEKAMGRRHQHLKDEDRAILEYVYTNY